MMKRYVSILRDQYRALSLREFITFLWHALFKSERLLIYCRSLVDSEIIDEQLTTVRVRKGELADLESARKHLGRLVWEYQCDRYDGVSDYFVYQRNGVIGHISWLYYWEDPNRLLRLGEKECEIKFCLTLPELRGQGLYPAALQMAQRYLKESGYERCFICVKKDNLSSIRGIEKSGVQLVGKMRLRKLFGLQISSKSDTRRLAVEQTS